MPQLSPSSLPRRSSPSVMGNHTQNDRRMNREWFSALVEDLVSTNAEMKYMDAVLELCEKHEIEEAVAATFISKSIEQHIMAEAIERNMYKETTAALEEL